MATINASSFVFSVGLCALLANACGGDGKPQGPAGKSEDAGSVDAASPDAGKQHTPPAADNDGGAQAPHEDTPSVGTGTDAGAEKPTAQRDGGTSQPASGVLLDLPHDGKHLSICYANADCKDGLQCYASFATAPGFCSERCESDSNCSPIDGLKATCAPEGQCRVDCSGKDNKGDGACPANMQCRDFFDPSLVTTGQPSGPGAIQLWRCGYPVDGGSNQVALYQKCDLSHGSGDCSGDLECHAPTDGILNPVNPGYCAQACQHDSQCTAPSGTSSVPACTAGACELDCGAPGATCPSGMNCRPVVGLASQAQRCRIIDAKTP